MNTGTGTMVSTRSMRRAAWLIAACMGLAGGAAPGAESNPFWTEITVTHSCEAMVPAYCTGANGYTIFSDGHWRAGPSRDGVSLDGHLTATEQARLNEAIQQLGADGVTAQKACETTGGIPGSGSTVRLRTPQGSAIVAVSGIVPPDLKCHGGPLAARTAVAEQVEALLGRYYPRPFPAVAVSRSTVRPEYLGCFKDQGDPAGTAGRDLPGFFNSQPKMTTSACIEECERRGFDYAGTQYATQCFCGNDYGKSGPALDCNAPCGGASNEICGGTWANSVYATRNAARHRRPAVSSP